MGFSFFFLFGQIKKILVSETNSYVCKGNMQQPCHKELDVIKMFFLMGTLLSHNKFISATM